MYRLFLLVILFQAYIFSAAAQSNQQKAQDLVIQFLNNKSNQNITFNPILALRNSYETTKEYRNYRYKIDSLEVIARRIDAQIPKLKTTAEINQSKKDSKSISNQLVANSNQMIDYMTNYKGQQTGWIIKVAYRTKKLVRKKFYLNLELTKVDSVR